MVVGTLATTLAACLAGAEYSPVANVPETWKTDANWTVAGNATRDYTPEQMASKANVGSLPLSGLSAILADGSASGGRFVGNYTNSAITHISFDVKRVGMATLASLNFTGADGDRWTHTFALPATQGVWAHVEVPVTYSADWRRNGDIGTVGEFERDRAAVVDVYILNEFSGSGEQSLAIDNFKVLGPWEKGPMTADLMPSYWLMLHGIPVEDGQAILDADHDGFNNYAEYLAGSDPQNSASQFKLEIDKDQSGSPLLRWKHENYRTYQVLRSSDLTQAASFAPVEATISNRGESDEAPVPSEVSAVNFYKIQIDVKQ